MLRWQRLLVSSGLLSVLLTSAPTTVAAWKAVSVDDFGASGDNSTDNTKAFRSALAAVKQEGGGEVLVPATGVYRTGPVNLTSNVVLRVEGTMRAVQDRTLFPKVAILPSVRRDPLGLSSLPAGAHSTA
jgi:polygalacturonase